ncbi:hypothetical protein [uncultured Proteiniphilum sp.]|uniref:hypothetical protein n=1 Tax=uncultured Proteiniphilum sp. TaxID=497637 RepID=UPI0026101AFB|nr:hypothetical protein [uncultured Proteiniphilum sp.]
MKKALFLLFLVFSMSCFSQGDKYVYASAKWGNKLTCLFYLNDQNPEAKYANDKDYELKNNKGEVMYFKHEMQFVNYLANQGWEFIHIVNKRAIQSGSETVFYFRKPQSEFTQEELNKIIKKE